MKRLILTLFMIGTFISTFAQKDIKGEKKAPVSEGVTLVQRLNKTSPFDLDEERLSLLKSIETYSDPYSDQAFKDYMSKSGEEAEELERTVPIYYAFRAAFDKVLLEVKTTKVKKGTVAVWMLYNMGFVVKTSSGCFGIDVHHRLAEDLEPYLDFLCITHNHGDHANKKLIQAMQRKGKPVVSNFNQESPLYMSKTATSYTIGNFTIRTDISDHLLDPALPDFVMLLRIECGKDAGDFSLLHCGDSGFNPAHFKNVQGPVNMVVLRWGAARENNILGNGEGQVQTKYAILSHLLELAHKPYPKGQASITQTLKHLPHVKCENTIIPFWGEKLLWKNGKLQ